MNFKYFLLLITLKNIVCYTTKRETPISSNLKHLNKKTPDPVTPARYQVVSKTNYDPINTDYFPAVEHPSSVIDASKPFYISSSPFSDEVTTMFKSLSDRNNAKPTIDYTWKPKEVKEEKVKEAPKKDNKVVTNIKPMGINVEDKNIVNEEPKELNVEDDSMKNELPGNHADQFINTTTTTPTGSDEMKYVIELINDLDEFMKNITNIEEEYKENNNDNTTVSYESVKPEEFTTMSSVMTSNDTNTVFNGNSFTVEDIEQVEAPFEKTDVNVTTTMMPDHGVANITSMDVVDDTEANVYHIETLNEASNITYEN